MTSTFRIVRKAALRSVAVLAMYSMAACNLTDVTNPTKLEESDVGNATGVDLMRRNVLTDFFIAASTAAEMGGAFADEYFVNQMGTSVQSSHDLRLTAYESNAVYMQWQALRKNATLTMTQLDAHGTAAQRTAYRGQMLTVRGYAVLSLGEDFCPGFPLHELEGYTAVVGAPIRTTAEVLERALADLDSAVILAADSARILNFARVARGRTLLGLGRFAEAAAAVQAVPSSYDFRAEFGASGSGAPMNPLARFTMPGMGPVGSVSNREGGNGLDFVTAGDPRVKTVWDEQWKRYRAEKYLNWESPMVVSSGVEARLIEAEAALRANSPSWLDILNNLRTTQVTPALAPLADPGSAEARVDLLFRERAFWLFATGHRLGDLRRLMRVYNRTSASLFPTGVHPFRGEVYETATRMQFPVSQEAAFNPAVTGCTDQ